MRRRGRVRFPDRVPAQAPGPEPLDELDQLRLLGADTVVLDPYHGEPRRLRPPYGSLLAGPTTMDTTCEPRTMCEAVIRQAGLGRVVFALSGERLLTIRPAGGRPPVPQDGPALLEEVRAVVEGYYRVRPS